MEFRDQVRNRGIAWPTQRKFDSVQWLRRAAQLADDELDQALARTGLWVAETLTSIRVELEELSIWRCSMQKLAQYAVGLCNRDLAVFRAMSLVDEQGQVTTLYMDEQLHHAIDQDLLGSGKISDLIESSVDAADRMMAWIGKKGDLPSNKTTQLADLIRGMNYVVAYQMAEDCFHQALWLDWRVVELADRWLVYPTDLETERRWEASWRRYSDLLSQTAILGLDVWRQDPQGGLIRYRDTGGVREIALEEKDGLVDVHCAGWIVPERPPRMLEYEYVANEAYYEPLVREPLPSLADRSVLDLLRCLAILGEVAEKVLDSVPSHLKVEDLSDSAKFCPIVLHRTLSSAIREITDCSRDEANALLKAFVWKAGKSFWFQPLVKVSTEKGPGYLFVMLPLTAPNVYRMIDYWLANFGLPMERRGELFEEQISVDLRSAARAGEVDDQFEVTGSRTLISRDGSSREEIDALILLHDLLVVGEAKCQTLPATPVDRHNYLGTLQMGAEQAQRKAGWVSRNLDVAPEALGVELESLSGRVQPIVITNHSVGAGLVIQDVPVMDILLLGTKLDRTYLTLAKFTNDGSYGICRQ